MEPVSSYLCLDHLHSLHAYGPEPVENTDTGLSLHLLHDDVQQDQCPRTTHPRTAVDQQWLLLGDGVQFTDVTDEANERHDIVGHSVIRPGCVVEMSHCHVLGVCLCQLQFRVWTQSEKEIGSVCGHVREIWRVSLSVR